jgi:hypothetical protein
MVHDPGWDLSAVGVGVALNIWNNAGLTPSRAEFDNLNLDP